MRSVKITDPAPCGVGFFFQARSNCLRLSSFLQATIIQLSYWGFYRGLYYRGKLIIDSDSNIGGCLEHDGFKALAAGIIMRAIDDYKMLESAGVIVNGKFDDRFYQPSSWFTRADQRSVDRQTFEDAHSLLRFFHLESFDSMARFAGVVPDAVRYKMGIKS